MSHRREQLRILYFLWYIRRTFRRLNVYIHSNNEKDSELASTFFEAWEQNEFGDLEIYGTKGHEFLLPTLLDYTSDYNPGVPRDLVNAWFEMRCIHHLPPPTQFDCFVLDAATGMNESLVEVREWLITEIAELRSTRPLQEA